MVEASMPARRLAGLPRPKGGLLFGYSLGCLAVLGYLVVAYLRRDWAYHLAKPDPMLGIGWWGAVGGVLANLETIHRTGDRWHPKSAFWYYARPITAAIFGGIGYVIYVSLVQASLNGPASDGAQLDKAPTALGYVLAFALGLREQTFRDLLKRVFDLLAGAGGADVEPPSVPPEFTADRTERDHGVRLTWGHSTDNVGVVAYHVYRDYVFLAAVRPYREQSDEDDPTPPQRPAIEKVTFVDQCPAGGGFYSVTAVDQAGNESVPAGPRHVGM